MAGIDCCLDGLKKCRRTPELKEHTAEERRTLLHGSMAVNPARARYVAGRACLAAGAKSVRVIALARTAKII